VKSKFLSWGPRLVNLRFLAVLLCCCMPLSSALADDWQFSGVNRVVAVSDVHGAYDALVPTFQEAGIIDENLAWSGGDTHLVITGDLLDRGPGSRQIMDLIMRLEREAVRAGGQVHQLLGNHEVMNLIGDVRYVSDSEYAAFIEDESAQEREYWFQQFKQNQPADADELTVRAEFDQKAPPGFFGHRRAFRNDGYYGKWLLEKPLMIVINGTAFVHGGAPPYVAEHGLSGVNVTLKADLVNYLAALSTLEAASVLSPVDRYREAPPILTEKMEAGQLDETMMVSATAILELRKSPLNNSQGPMWYRGTARCNRLIEGDGLNAVLDKIGATQIVIGHTPTSTRRVQQRMNQRVIEIDTGMLKANYHGSGNALVLEDELVKVVNQDGAVNLSPVAHPMGVGHEAGVLDDELLEKILATGSIEVTETDGPTWKLLQVVAFDKTVFAYFNALPASNDFAPDIAAYRLDRMLGLYMVPVTVRREVGGRPGTLQYVPAATLSERERVTSSQGGRATCSMAKQQGAMYAFDVLIHNPARTPESMLYDTDSWQLMLVDHRNAFGTQTSRPAYLANAGLTIGNEWRTTLLNLDDDRLRKYLGDILDKSRLTALAKRRDDLIKGSMP
jgi:hypothetical protein